METTLQMQSDERPKNGWSAFWEGLSQAVRLWPALLVMYLVLALTALLLAVLPAISLLGPAHYTSVRQAASGIPLWMIEDWVSNLVLSSSGGASEVSGLSGSASSIVFSALISAVLLPVLAWLPANALSGGLLLAYVDAPQPFNWRRFIWGCWHWLAAFLLLGLVELVITLIAASVLTFLLVVISPLGQAWLALFLAAVFLILWVAVLALIELTRVYAVLHNTRNLFQAFGQALQYAVRHPVNLGGLYLLALLLLLGLHFVFRLELFPRLPLAVWPLVLVCQQAFVLLRLWARSGRYASDSILAKSPNRSLNPTGMAGIAEGGITNL